MQVDYIIVGLGLAGLAFAETLEKHGKSFIVFNDSSQQSSKVAAGVYNPVVLKRFTPVWDVEDKLRLAMSFYRGLEKKLKATYDHKYDIYRIFNSVEEQNNWFEACDKPILKKYLQPKILKNENTAVIAPFGFGEVTQTGKIDTKKLLSDYENYLLKENKFRKEQFIYSEITFLDGSVTYKDIHTKKILFCEGFGVKSNPYFKDVPLEGTKGELMTIHAPELQIDVILKGSLFVLPLGNNHYRVGATFNWKDKTSNPTSEGKQELQEKLEKIINVPYDIVEHWAGIRPTVRDRRPLLGKHQNYNELAILNGFGTRGVLLAPKMARLLYNHLEINKPLPEEVAIDRFA